MAADTVVAQGDHILGKPVDMDDARKMIQLLNGNTHEVLTGISIFAPGKGKFISWVARTTVYFKTLSDEDIDHYLSVSRPLDKAGAYAIQEHQDLLIESIEGSYNNVVGLPIEEVLEELQKLGVTG